MKAEIAHRLQLETNAARCCPCAYTLSYTGKVLLRTCTYRYLIPNGNWICVCACTSMHIHIYNSNNIYIHVCTPGGTYVHTHTHTHAYDAYIHTHAYTTSHDYTFEHSPLHILIHACLHTRIHTCRSASREEAGSGVAVRSRRGSGGGAVSAVE